MRGLFLFAACLCLPVFVSAKTLIFTYQCARPDFLQLQCKALKKFCQDDYELVVFDDAPNVAYSHYYKQICDLYGARYEKVEPSIHTYAYLERYPGEMFDHPSVRNANVVEYSLRLLGREHRDMLFLLDGDVVPVKPFSLSSWMGSHNVLGIPQSRSEAGKKIEYLWIGFCALNMKGLPDPSMINFNCGKVEGVSVDPGGYMHYYMKKYSSELSILPTAAHLLTSEEKGALSPLAGWNMEAIAGGRFIHFRGSSGWDYPRVGFFNEKLERFKRFVNERIGED